MKSYSIRSSVVLAATFTDTVTDDPVDPTTVLLRVYSPDGVMTTYSSVDFTHPSTGLYQKKIIPDLTGIWRYRWQGRGIADTTYEKVFEVRPSIFTDVYRLTFETLRYLVTGNLLVSSNQEVEVGPEAPAVGTYVTKAQLLQWLAVNDTGTLGNRVADLIPANPYDPVNIGWASGIMRRSDDLYEYVQATLALSDFDMNAAFEYMASYPLTPMD